MLRGDASLQKGRAAISGYDWERPEPYNQDELLAMIDNLAARWFYGDHTAIGRRFVGGELHPGELRLLATQEYGYYKETTWWNAGKLLGTVHLAEQRVLHGALIDELGTDLVDPDGLPSHSELFLRYCEGLGLDKQEVMKAPLAPSVVLATTELRRIASSRPSFEMVVASNLVIERQRPAWYARLLATFADSYSWVPPESLEFYQVHAEHDTDHESRGRQLVRRYITTKAQQDLAMAAALRSVGLRWVMYDGIERALQDPDSPLIPKWPGLPGDPWPRPTSIEL